MCEPFWRQADGGQTAFAARKKYIRQAARQWGFAVFEKFLPLVRHTARSDMAETWKSLYAVSRQSRRCIENAIRPLAAGRE